MSARNSTPLSLVLAAGATSAAYNVGGDRVFVLASDNPTFLVQFDGQGDFAPLGLGINPAADAEFTSVKFKNPNAGTLTAEVVIGFWNYSDNRMHFAGVGLPVTIESEPFEELSTTMLAGVKTAATKIWTGTGAGGTVSIQNVGKGGGGGAVFLGKANTVSTADFGSLLSPALTEYQPGGSVTFPAASDIWAFSHLTNTYVALTATQLETP